MGCKYFSARATRVSSKTKKSGNNTGKRRVPGQKVKTQNNTITASHGVQRDKGHAFFLRHTHRKHTVQGTNERSRPAYHSPIFYTTHQKPHKPHQKPHQPHQKPSRKMTPSSFIGKFFFKKEKFLQFCLNLPNGVVDRVVVRDNFGKLPVRHVRMSQLSFLGPKDFSK